MVRSRTAKHQHRDGIGALHGSSDDTQTVVESDFGKHDSKSKIKYQDAKNTSKIQKRIYIIFIFDFCILIFELLTCKKSQYCLHSPVIPARFARASARRAEAGI